MNDTEVLKEYLRRQALLIEYYNQRVKHGVFLPTSASSHQELALYAQIPYCPKLHGPDITSWFTAWSNACVESATAPVPVSPFTTLTARLVALHSNMAELRGQAERVDNELRLQRAVHQESLMRRLRIATIRQKQLFSKLHKIIISITGSSLDITAARTLTARLNTIVDNVNSAPGAPQEKDHNRLEILRRLAHVATDQACRARALMN